MTATIMSGSTAAYKTPVSRRNERSLVPKIKWKTTVNNEKHGKCNHSKLIVNLSEETQSQYPV